MDSNSQFPGKNIPDLIGLARQGDAEALDRLCKILFPYVTRMCRKALPGRMLPKIGNSDLVQEIMLDVSHDFANFRGEGGAEFVKWVAVIAQNKSRDVERYLLAQKRDIGRECRIAEGSSVFGAAIPPDPTPPPLEQLIDAEEAGQLQQRIASLPERYQQVLTLRHRRGLSFPQIAIELKMTEPTVKNIYARAMQKLEPKPNHDDGLGGAAVVKVS